MEIEEILDVFRKTGNMINYFKIGEYFKQDDLKKISDLVNDGALKIQEVENGIFISLLEKEEEKAQKMEAVEIKELRKEVIADTLKGIVKPEENTTLSDLFNSLILMFSTKMDKKERKEIVKKIWFMIPINEVSCYKISDKIYYKFIIEGKNLEFSDTELFDWTVFRKSFFNIFGVSLPGPSEELYSFWLMYQKAKAKDIEELHEMEREEDIITDALKNYIENSFVTTNLEEVYQYNFIFISECKKYILIPNEVILKIMEDNIGSKINYKRIAFVLNNAGYLLKTEPKWVPGLGTKRFWLFDKSKFKLKVEVEEESEQKTLGDTGEKK